MNPRIFIVIPAGGKADYTRLAIKAARLHTSGCTIIVVESDPLTEWEESPDLIVLRPPEFVSFSNSVNLALRAIPDDADYIVLLNNDTVVTQGWFEPLKTALDDGYCIAGPVTNSCGHGEQVVSPSLEFSSPTDVDMEALDRFAASLEDERSPVFGVVGFCMAFNAYLPARIGLFDERFLIGNFEDNDWCLRASEQNPKGCCVCKNSFVWHFGSVTFREHNTFTPALTANQVRFERKWLGKAEVPKRHNNPLYRTNRIALNITAIYGDDAGTLGHISREMESRGFWLEATDDAVEIPVDTNSVPELGDDFYEFCDIIELDAIEEMDAIRAGELPDLSVCMIVKDEEAVLDRCLRSMAPLAKQLVVVDTGSGDATVAIAKRHNAEVYHHAPEVPFNFSAARNYSISKAKCDWVLIIDADEVLLSDAVDTIRRMVQDGTEAAHMITTRLYQTNPHAEGLIPNDGVHPDTADYCGFLNSVKIRLWPRGFGLQFRNKVHETVEQSAMEANRKIERCDAVIHHFGGRVLTEKDDLYAELGYEKVRDNPCHATYRELGLQLHRMDQCDEAVVAFRKAMKYEPDDVECRILIAASLCHLGYTTEGDDAEGFIKQAEEYYTDALEADPENELGNRYYATHLNRMKRYREAYWPYRKIIGHASRAGDVKTMCDYAWVCQHLGQHADAIDILEKAEKVNQQYVHDTGMLECAHHSAGVLAGRNGDMITAVREFQRALEIKPDFEEAKHNLHVAEQWVETDSNVAIATKPSRNKRRKKRLR